jgi:hypothetical protein
MILFAFVLQLATEGPHVARLERVTAGAGARDHAAAIPVPGGVVVLWEQAAGIDRATQARPPVRIWRAQVGGFGSRAPRVLVSQEDNQWWPAPLPGPSPLLAVYSAHKSRKTGDRDVLLYRPTADWRAVRLIRPLTRDPGSSPFPLNDATPALARTTSGRIVAAWSSGAYRAGESYRDKDIRLATLTPDGSLVQTRPGSDSTELGHEYAPALVEAADGRLLLVYASDSAGARYDLYVRQVDSSLHAGPPSRLTWSAAGATQPSLIRVGSAVWLAWQDLGTNDVRMAQLEDGRLRESHSLRALLRSTTFEQAGVPLAGLAGASLFADSGRLGLAFVATLSVDPAGGRIQQDVFVAWLAP